MSSGLILCMPKFFDDHPDTNPIYGHRLLKAPLYNKVALQTIDRWMNSIQVNLSKWLINVDFDQDSILNLSKENYPGIQAKSFLDKHLLLFDFENHIKKSGFSSSSP